MEDNTIPFALYRKAQIIDLTEDVAASTVTSGVANPDAKPMIKKSHFMGHPVIEVDDNTYCNCIQGKQPFARWSKYVEDEALRDEMKKTFQRSQRMLMMNSKTGAMAYVK